MSYFDINSLKGLVVDKLREKIEPINTSGTLWYNLRDTDLDVKYAQSFYPYSSTISTISIYAWKGGSPTGTLTLSIETDNNNSPSGTSIGSITFTSSEITTENWYSKTVSIGNNYVISKNKYWLVAQANGQDNSNYFMVGRDSINTNYFIGSASKYDTSWNTLNIDLKFKVISPEWIYKIYPSDTISDYDFPRIAIDVMDRPRTNEKYIDHRRLEYLLNVGILIYSLYQDEVDSIASHVERAIIDYRTSFSSYDIATPGRLGPITLIRDKIYVRPLYFTFQKKITAS